jgi:hypothetical protein
MLLNIINGCNIDKRTPELKDLGNSLEKRFNELNQIINNQNYNYDIIIDEIEILKNDYVTYFDKCEAVGAKRDRERILQNVNNFKNFLVKPSFNKRENQDEDRYENQYENTYHMKGDGRLYESKNCGLCNGTGFEEGRNIISREIEHRICPMCEGRGQVSY